MERAYEYIVSGTAYDGQTWITQGTITTEFHKVFDTVMKESFQKLTNGEAVYGFPGLGCQGPYKVTKLVIATVKEH